MKAKIYESLCFLILYIGLSYSDIMNFIYETYICHSRFFFQSIHLHGVSIREICTILSTFSDWFMIRVLGGVLSLYFTFYIINY